jgi:CheY-like chemotaxis protein
MMPEMDGLEAVSRIRELNSDYAKNVPIIALTANAVVGNEELFLSKGFQAFLPKPIDISRLDAIIRQWIYDPEQDKLYTGVDTPEQVYAKDIVLLKDKKVNGLNLKEGVKRFNGDEEVYIKILHSYTVNTRKMIDSIKDIPEGKLKDYQITVHSIKGSSFGICADAVGRVAADLESAAKVCEMEYIRKHHYQFISIVTKLINDIEKLLKLLDLDNQKPRKKEPDKLVLLKLAAACEAYDMDEVDDAIKELTSYRYEYDNELVTWLNENVDLMNFDEIVERLGLGDRAKKIPDSEQIEVILYDREERELAEAYKKIEEQDKK